MVEGQAVSINFDKADKVLDLVFIDSHGSCLLDSQHSDAIQRLALSVPMTEQEAKDYLKTPRAQAIIKKWQNICHQE